jgi:hypothetical protein
LKASEPRRGHRDKIGIREEFPVAVILEGIETAPLQQKYLVAQIGKK